MSCRLLCDVHRQVRDSLQPVSFGLRVTGQAETGHTSTDKGDVCNSAVTAAATAVTATATATVTASVTASAVTSFPASLATHAGVA